MIPLVRGIPLLAVAALAAGAKAGTVYDVIPGSSSFITLQVYSSSGTLLMSGSNALPLTAPSEMTIDYSGMTIPTFLLEDLGTTAVGLSGPYTGDSLQVTNAAITPGSGYTSSLTGSNPSYNYSLNQLSGSTGGWVLSHGSTTLYSGGPTSGSTAGPLTGSLSVNGDSSITIDGIVLGDIAIAGQTDVLKADVTFYGSPVPLPPAVVLLGSALLGLGIVTVRRRAATDRRDV